MSEVKIMIAEEKDLEAMGDMHYLNGKKHREACGMPERVSSKEEMLAVVQSIFNNPKSVLFKAVCNGEICGCLFLWIFECEEAKTWSKSLEIGHISEIFVYEKYRRQGIATKMITYIEKYLKDRDICSLDLEVFAFNKEARAFYDSLKFREIKRYLHKDLLDK